MSRLSIIPCGNRKIWDKQPQLGKVSASEAYIGTFHTLCQRYASAFTDNWVVLSAKHGFLLAEDMVDGPYDLTFNQKSDAIISIIRLQEQVREKQLDQYDELIVLTGKKYKKIIESSFGLDFPANYPLLTYKGIGYMQQALKNAVKTGKAIH